MELVDGKSVHLEEYARQMVHDEELHLTEVDKMIRRPGSLETERA
jgi:bacterioferritin